MQNLDPDQPQNQSPEPSTEPSTEPSMGNSPENRSASSTTDSTPDSATDSATDSEFDHLEADEQEMAGLEEALGGINQLTEVGNRATQLGLIVGHGYHGGQYEILCKGEIMTLAPEAAVAFLQDLIQPESPTPQPPADADASQGAEG